MPFSIASEKSWLPMQSVNRSRNWRSERAFVALGGDAMARGVDGRGEDGMVAGGGKGVGRGPAVSDLEPARIGFTTDLRRLQDACRSSADRAERRRVLFRGRDRL